MQKKPTVIYMGTPEFAVAPLEALLQSRLFEIVTVVTQEDKKVGRKQVLTPPPVKVVAENHNLPVLQPPNVKNNQQFHDLLAKLSPDFIVVIAYGQILPKDILEIPRYGCVNIHGSLLPKYRGASPIEEAILRGDAETGITFMKMEEKMDAGPILHLERTAIAKDDTAQTLRVKLSLLAAQLLPVVLKDIMDGVASPIPQDETKATYCHKISKNDGRIDLKKLDAEQIERCVRAYTPWPSCFLSLGEKKLKLLQIQIDPKKTGERPGQAVEREDGTIAIGTKKGVIIPISVQLEGKNPMSFQDFLRGNRPLLKELLASPK